MPFPEVLDQIADLHHLDRVESHGGLIEDDDLRTAQERLGDPDALLISFGQIFNEPVRHIADLGLFHDPLHLVRQPLPRHLLRLRDKSQILPRRLLQIERRLLRQVADQLLRFHGMLKDVVSADGHRA